MHVSWIDVLRWAVMLGIFYGICILLLKYSLRFFEELGRSRDEEAYVNPETKWKSWFLRVVINQLVAFEMILGALAIWAIWTQLPGDFVATLVMVMGVLIFALWVMERLRQSLT